MFADKQNKTLGFSLKIKRNFTKDLENPETDAFKNLAAAFETKVRLSVYLKKFVKCTCNVNAYLH